MRTLQQLLIIVCCGTTIMSGQSGPPKPAGISGKVLLKDGTPLVGATVYALPGVDMRHQIATQTDRDGGFLLTGIPPGEAYLHVFDEQAGYADNFFAFYAIPGDDLIKVVVAPNTITTDIIFHLADKAARLKLEILDDNGKPIQDAAQLAFTRPDTSADYSRASGSDVSMLVPPVPFSLKIQVNGFKPWHYSDTSGTSALLTPRPGETVTVVAHLRNMSPALPTP
jgi:hypothetical protein